MPAGRTDRHSQTPGIAPSAARSHLSSQNFPDSTDFNAGDQGRRAGGVVGGGRTSTCGLSALASPLNFRVWLPLLREAPGSEDDDCTPEIATRRKAVDFMTEVASAIGSAPRSRGKLLNCSGLGETQSSQ